MSTEFTFVGRHAETLADGRPIGPGEKVKLSANEQKEAHNKRLIDDGLLLEMGKQSSSKRQTTEEGN